MLGQPAEEEHDIAIRQRQDLDQRAVGEAAFRDERTQDAALGVLHERARRLGERGWAIRLTLAGGFVSSHCGMPPIGESSLPDTTRYDITLPEVRLKVV